ncbi:MAG: DUF927 domain-containing protein [Ruminococcus sp.]|nr:DUF927 domain-containing protein [Ruminococcus sp.]
MEITKEQLADIRYEDPKAVIDVLSDMVLHGGTASDSINNQIAVLRENAIEKGRRDVFERCFRIMLEGLSDHIEEKKLNIHLVYTKADFLESTEPYREVAEIEVPFFRQQRIQQLSANAKAVGFSGFLKMYKEYERTQRIADRNVNLNISNPTLFPDQPIELDCGDWQCDENGVQKSTGYSTDIACCHPIMPTERLVNIDTGEEKLKISYSKGGRWRSVIFGKDVLFVASKIVQLAAVGIAVTSENAKMLVRYICDIENRNYDVLPEHSSVGRLGYVGDDGIFSPYHADLIFDGESNYKEIYNAIRCEGDFDQWKKTAIDCRNHSKTAQILLASSFASVLVSRVGALPFFVHLWGVESGTGKTVGLMLAASVWGDPAIGRYVQTFNATQVSHERTAGFLNNIPLCIDELQLSKDSHGNSKFDVYQLAQGVGRGRGNRAGGIDRTPTWSLCILTTGESPIIQAGAGAGAANRVIDIECCASKTVVSDGMSVSASIKQNFGHAGKFFVEHLTHELISKAKAMYARHFRMLSTRDTTEKQAMAAALILTADELADELIFHTDRHLTEDEIGDFLQTKASVSAGERGYRHMCDWVAMNANRFALENPGGEIYGILDNGWAYINSGVFRKAAQESGFDPRALLSWLKTRGLILTRGRNFTRGKRIHGVNTECVVMRLPEYGGSETADTFECQLL